MSLFTDGCYQCAPAEALIAKVLAGRCTMHYTKVAVGSGSIPEGSSPATMTEPAGYVMDAKLSGVTNPVDGECQVTAQITSDDVAEDFSATGVLLYAQDPDLGDVPYTYLVLESAPEPIKSAVSTVGKIAIFELVAAVGAVDNVTADIDLKTLVTAEKVAEMIASHNADKKAHPDIRKIAQDALDQVEALTHTISDDRFTLTRIFKLNALGEKLAFVFLEIDFQNIVVGFLPEAVTINFFRIGNTQTFQIVVHSVTSK